MSALDQLKEYRVVRVVLPLAEGGQQLIDGVAKATNPPELEITFLPDQLNADALNMEEPCQISFDIAGSTKAIRAKITEVVSDAKLQMEMVESFTHVQKRAYFRVDADLSVSYWLLEAENPLARSIQTPVNISGGGVRLPVDEPLPDGTEIGLELVLDVPEPRVVECAAKVVRTYEGGPTGKQAALTFIDLDEEDQDAIVAYCLAEQRKQLRLKVQVLGR
ncbi:PilZ domain-containing protein [Malonomonas rubra DSM 5091]|uniref:PilZ domain-containing protein n=1 Tax=Malonomonas rubra DSM 5091 TaxID=1122189 RepID=A0A1M6LAZ6_MALRU|nr:PilZ domain-containing protein [Malonomonas rubra]SHJ68334.1 PilZ domain-containing protein [Malonomonas rubra DSM 5091]